MTTELFQTMKAAEAEFTAADAATSPGANAQALKMLDALEAAERAYFAAVIKARAEWDALPEGARKDSAETNANETEGTEADRLFWLQIAVGSFHLLDDCQ